MCVRCCLQREAMIFEDLEEYYTGVQGGREAGEREAGGREAGEKEVQGTGREWAGRRRRGKRRGRG